MYSREDSQSLTSYPSREPSLTLTTPSQTTHPASSTETYLFFHPCFIIITTITWSESESENENEQDFEHQHALLYPRHRQHLLCASRPALLQPHMVKHMPLSLPRPFPFLPPLFASPFLLIPLESPLPSIPSILSIYTSITSTCKVPDTPRSNSSSALTPPPPYKPHNSETTTGA